MAGLSSHADFLELTRARRVLQNKKRFLNEVTKRNYFFFSTMLRKEYAKFQGGTKIVDQIQGANSGNSGWYDPNDEFSPTQKDVFTPVNVAWAFHQGHYVIIDETAILNTTDSDSYLNYINTLDIGCVIDMADHLEKALWARPNKEKMEDANVSQREMYSIRSFVTQDGLAPSATNETLATGSSAWTTVATINPSTNTWWKNANNTYTAATPDDAEAGLIGTFDDMVLLVKYEMPNGIDKWSERQDLQNQVICTNRDGVVFYKARLRNLNDRMQRFNDPAIVGPQFDGIPVKYVDELDNAGWTANQPDYFFLNLRYLFPFFHKNRFMHEVVETGGSKQPNSTAAYKFSFLNTFCRSRRSQGRTYAA